MKLNIIKKTSKNYQAIENFTKYKRRSNSLLKFIIWKHEYIIKKLSKNSSIMYAEIKTPLNSRFDLNVRERMI